MAHSAEHGLLVDLRGALGHVPAAEAGDRRASANALGRAHGEWEGEVVAIAGDLVHLCRRSGEGRDARPVRHGEVLNVGRSGALVRLEGDGSLAVVPWEELSWEPSLAPRELERGERVEGRVVGLTLDGPVLSPRALVPSPWPAIALALPPGTRCAARLEAVADGTALLRTARPPRAAAVVDAAVLPPGAGPDAVLEATIARVDAIGGALVVGEVTFAAARAPRPERAAPTPEPREPGQAASGSCS
ncbi:MAG TPA: hypothetical protein VHF89_18035 [Solirubrobacteraceae bacterium]|nr:hypothetical protein [Solirubrobacteraceae bacterium]